MSTKPKVFCYRIWIRIIEQRQVLDIWVEEIVRETPEYIESRGVDEAGNPTTKTTKVQKREWHADRTPEAAVERYIEEQRDAIDTYHKAAREAEGMLRKAIQLAEVIRSRGPQPGQA